jgi:hypothetical protein
LLLVRAPGRSAAALAFGTFALSSLCTVALGAASGACSSAEKLQGQGGICFQVSDCQEGLACVPQKDGSRICTNDLTPIQMAAEAGGGAKPDAAGDASGDGAASDATTPTDSAMPVDTGTPSADTGTPPLPDTGSPSEAAPGGDAASD